MLALISVWLGLLTFVLAATMVVYRPAMTDLTVPLVLWLGSPGSMCLERPSGAEDALHAPKGPRCPAPTRRFSCTSSSARSTVNRGSRPAHQTRVPTPQAEFLHEESDGGLFASIPFSMLAFFVGVW